MSRSVFITEFILASALDDTRETLLANFCKRLQSSDIAFVKNEAHLSQAIALARRVIDGASEYMRTGQISYSERIVKFTWQADPTQARISLRPADSLRIATMLFEVALEGLLATAAAKSFTASCMGLAARALHCSIMTHLQGAYDSYVSFLLDSMHEVQLAERRRITRELHDRVGGPASVVTRNLELAQAYAGTDGEQSRERTEVAYRSSVATLDALRCIAANLRLKTEVDNLEKSLRSYVDSMAGPEVKVDLAVSGDESWAPVNTLDEVLLVLREALRNAFSHARAATVTTQVDIAPHEIRAWVIDDGMGFDIACPHTTRGTGLISMRERVQLLGGQFVMESTPGRGTHVELSIPLSRTI